MKAIASAIRSINHNKTQTHLSPCVAFKSLSALKFFLVGLTIVTAMNSCVPLAIGAAGVAAGYIARDEGIGVAEPADSSSSPDTDNTYESYEPEVY